MNQITESEILHDEAAFADSQYKPFETALAINPTMFAKYSQPRHRWDCRQFAAILMGDLRGKRVLDLGCGMGEEASYFAKLGASVTAIDVSSVGIQITRDRAAFNSVEIDARIMPCPTTLPAASFDIVHGLGIIHHIGVSDTLSEVRRLLKPGGTAVFFEPMGNCPPLEKVKGLLHSRLVSRMSLKELTEHERPLEWREIVTYRSWFDRFELYPYNLLCERLDCGWKIWVLLEV